MSPVSRAVLALSAALALACASATESPPPPAAQVAVAAAPAAAPAPAPAMEGDDPGECSDGADNDRDGKFDCDDSDCTAAPSCKAPAGLHAYAVPLTAPWSMMNLPINDGVILYSDATSVTMTYSGGSVKELAAQYEYVILKEGWSETFKSTDGGMVTVTYSMQSRALTIAVMEAMGTATVSMTMI